MHRICLPRCLFNMASAKLHGLYFCYRPIVVILTYSPAFELDRQKSGRRRRVVPPGRLYRNLPADRAFWLWYHRLIELRRLILEWSLLSFTVSSFLFCPYIFYHLPSSDLLPDITLIGSSTYRLLSRLYPVWIYELFNWVSVRYVSGLASLRKHLT